MDGGGGGEERRREFDESVDLSKRYVLQSSNQMDRFENGYFKRILTSGAKTR
jgi:hypothetical protein